MQIYRTWAMPNKNTFSISSIEYLLKKEREVVKGLWIDPFAGSSKVADVTNDINPDMDTNFHLDALDFLKSFDDESVAVGLYDPPYSVRQVSECYHKYGYEVTQETTRSSWYTKHKEQFKRIIRPNGKVISFGWNSNGIGGDDFEKQYIMLVAHGGVHHDTIITVERKSLNSGFN